MSYWRPVSQSRKDEEETPAVDIVCVDGSEGADRAMQFALRETPPDHRLMLLFGAYVPHKEELSWGTFSVSSMREGHYWDKELPDVYIKYTDMCQKAGRKCDFIHFHFDRMSKFGDSVCSIADRHHAQNVILARRRRSERSFLGRFLGSGSQAVVDRCGDIPITLVTVKPDESK
ncbi:cyst specific protein CSP 21, putative [Acanthamoeba castellanii str. Neff]|uniref:Cyst specific protein CSP 21, putative n=1 Tax=Acanthamoeba castellanii (strain ATCC 30010 / Neff) TaxID=1257118 RepID=L8GIC2_ACACF|nr:cyst specific protein CSP 21, putative [Acanthamoeba castellanii str. Neff]ELR11931.1 cyst specific protein CSP 21, putative [Acanthamoeba castellanii str. Neff]